MKIWALFLCSAMALTSNRSLALNLDLPCKSQIDRFLSAYEIYSDNPTKNGTVTTFKPQIDPATRSAYDAALKKATTTGVPFLLNHAAREATGAPLYISGLGGDVPDLWGKVVTIEEKADGLVKIKISGYAKREAWVYNPKTRLNDRGVKLEYRSNLRIIDFKKSGKTCYLDGFQKYKTYVSAECCQQIYDKDALYCKNKAKEGDLTRVAKSCVTTTGKPEFLEENLADGVTSCRRYDCKGPKIFASMLAPKPNSTGQKGTKNLDNTEAPIGN